MPDFKDLHAKWKTAKKDAKLAWEMLDKMTANYTSAHKEMTFAVVRFPAFDKKLGPSLDNLHTLTGKKDVKDKDLPGHKKDLKKYKEAATAAVKQYDTDIKGLVSSRNGVKVPAETDKNKEAVAYFKQVLALVDREVKKLGEVLTLVDQGVKTVKDS